MAHEVDTMFSANGVVPWHGLGRIIREAPTSHDALVAAGLDWSVNGVPVAAKIGNSYSEIPNTVANVRSSDNRVLGIVSGRYQIVQNEEAFAFTDMLVNNEFGIDVQYETAGSLQDGKRVWMLAKLPMQTILGDKIVPYIAIINNHDGKGAVRVIMTPTRIVCQNTLTLGLSKAKRSWSTTHVGNLESKLEDAKNTLDLANAYMEALEEEAERLQQIAVSDKLFKEMLLEMYPHDPFSRYDTKNENNRKARELVTDIYKQTEDLSPFYGTAWGVYNAMADYASHPEPRRKMLDFTKYKERQLAGFFDGTSELDKFESVLRMAI